MDPTNTSSILDAISFIKNQKQQPNIERIAKVLKKTSAMLQKY